MQTRKGHDPSYCSAACSQAAYRQRLAEREARRRAQERARERAREEERRRAWEEEQRARSRAGAGGGTGGQAGSSHTHMSARARLFALAGLQDDGTHELKSVYRRAARQHHPDRGGDAELFKVLVDLAEMLGLLKRPGAAGASAG